MHPPCLQGALPHNPLVTHETDVRHLRDPAFLKGALRYRVARLLFTLQLRLRNQRSKVGDFYAWNACLNHILALAKVGAEDETAATPSMLVATTGMFSISVGQRTCSTMPPWRWLAIYACLSRSARSLRL